jgi:hypothetical protein
MVDESANKSEALQTSIERLFKESRRLREVSDRLAREAEELKKLVPREQKKGRERSAAVFCEVRDA